MSSRGGWPGVSYEKRIGTCRCGGELVLLVEVPNYPGRCGDARVYCKLCEVGTDYHYYLTMRAAVSRARKAYEVATGREIGGTT